MKYTLQVLLVTFLVLPFIGNAQNMIPQAVKTQAILAQQNATPFEVKEEVDEPIGTAQSPVIFQEEIGTTYFDNQSYGSMNHRLYERTDGTISAAWHFSAEASVWTDRGTGYNAFDGTSWGMPSRVEGDLRGGYPGFVTNNKGDEFVSSHVNEGSTWQLGFHQKLAGETAWTTGTIPTNTAGMVWGKLAISGDNEDIIHAIGITLAPDFGGQVYQGVTGHLLYYRSMDKGQTWDIQDMILPGIDSTNYTSIEAEAYTITARGDAVAIGVFPSWGNTVVLKSNDNGTSWTSHSLIDFPLDKYDDTPYGPADIGVDINDPELPDTLAIFTSDNTASMVIDNDGMAHVAFGRMFVSADGLGGRFYFPATSGIAYWNEDMGDNNLLTNTDVEDMDGDDLIGLESNEDIAFYGRSLTMMPSLGVDADNTIYMAYSALNELYYESEELQFYNQVFIIKQQTDGSWTSPFAVINEESVGQDIVPFVEGVFPAIPPVIGESIPLIYQQDFRPGMNTLGDEDIAELTSIVYVNLSKTDFATYTSAANIESPLAAKIHPNPSASTFFLEYDATSPTAIRYSVFNSLGKQLFVGGTTTPYFGFYKEKIDLTTAANGIYFVQLQTEQGTKTFKLVKE